MFFLGFYLFDGDVDCCWGCPRDDVVPKGEENTVSSQKEALGVNLLIQKRTVGIYHRFILNKEGLQH